MIRSIHARLFVLFMLSSALLTACGAEKLTATVDIQAQITQTMQAVATQAQATLQAAMPTPAPATNTPLPTETPLPTATPAPTQPPVPVATETSPAAAQIMVRLSMGTNCRTGPSDAFELIFVADKGTDLKIVSGTSLSDYVIVENPEAPGQTCWLWTRYAEISGDMVGLPVVTPPATPTPALKYSTSFIALEHCTGRSLAFSVNNRGATTIQSYSIVVTDQTVNETQTTTRNTFGKREGCVVANNIDFLHTDDNGYIYADNYSYDPSGHTMLVYITMCSNNDLGGECASEGYFVTP